MVSDFDGTHALERECLSLNPCCNGRWSQTDPEDPYADIDVLILVVMEDGLRLMSTNKQVKRWTRLNPCCNGRWSQTQSKNLRGSMALAVLILVVMEDGLRPLSTLTIEEFKRKQS